MKRARVLAFCSFGILFALAAVKADGLKLGTGQGPLGALISVPLTLTSTQQVQGVVVTADWDGAKLRGETLTRAAALASADAVVSRVTPGYAVLGVVMDSDGVDNEIIPPGTDIVLANLQFTALGPPGETPEDVALLFQDGKYATVDGGPLLDNIIVVGGLSIGQTEGLVLTNGSVRLLPPPPGEFKIQSISAYYGAEAKVPVLLSVDAPVQGFVTAIQNGAGITLTGIDIGPAALAADFVQPELFATGGTLGVVMDLYAPFPGTTIPAGANRVIAYYKYATPAITSAADCPKQETIALTFVDFVLGDPSKENVLVIGGRSKNPSLVNGAVSLSADQNSPLCRIVVPSELTFAVGSCTEMVDDPSDPDPDAALIPGPISAHPGEKIQIGLYYKSPEDNIADETQQKDQIQGVSMALTFDPTFIECKETYSLAGTITETVGAEFVNLHCENSLADGDPASLVVGILVDALPPFDGQTLPPTSDFLRLICVDFQVTANAPCNQISPITFSDGENGRGTVPIKNLASVQNQSVAPKLLNAGGRVIILAEPIFVRGDCNFHYSDEYPATSGPEVVDISDAQAVLSYLFLTGTWHFAPPCLDACDANDDGRIDLADSVYILRYLFKFAVQPKAPYPNPGPDPIDPINGPDRLTCLGGSVCN